MRMCAKGAVALGLWLWSLALMAAADAAVLVLGLPPYLTASELETRFQPLAQYLAGRLGLQVRLRVAHSHAQHIDQTGGDRVDIAFLTPTAYLMLVEQHAPRPLLGRLEVNGRASFGGTIFVRSDAPIRDLAQLRGHLFAFGSQWSAASYRVPRALLRQAGVDLQDLGGYRFLGTPENVALAVLAGDYAGGAVQTEVFERYRPRGLRAIAATPPIPEHLFVASARLPPALVARLHQSLIELRDSESGRAVLRAIRPDVTGIIDASPADYAALRDLFGELGRPLVGPPAEEGGL